MHHPVAQAALALFVAVSALLFAPVTAQAGFVLGPSLLYNETKVENGGTTGKTTVTAIDVRAGYLFPQGLFLGGIYNNETVKSGGFEQKGVHYGPSVGYVAKSFNFIASYLMAGELSYSGGSKRIEPTGPQLDVGYVFDVGSNLSVGPQITWRSLEYAKAEAGGVKVADKYKVTEIRPMVALLFVF